MELILVFNRSPSMGQVTHNTHMKMNPLQMYLTLSSSSSFLCFKKYNLNDPFNRFDWILRRPKYIFFAFYRRSQFWRKVKGVRIDNSEGEWIHSHSNNGKWGTRSTVGRMDVDVVAPPSVLTLNLADKEEEDALRPEGDNVGKWTDRQTWAINN